MDGWSGGRRGLEVSFPVSIPQDPLPRCAVHTEVTPSALAAEGSAQPFLETHTAGTVVLSHSLGKREHSPSAWGSREKAQGASGY